MTSANVSKMTANVPFQTNATAKTGKDGNESKDFMGMLGNLTANYQNVSNNDQNMSIADNCSTSKTEYGKYSVKEDRIPEASEKPDAVQLEGVQKEVEEFADEVQKAIEEVFGVSKEQMEEAMSELGLTFVDLMNPTNLANLVMKLTDEKDSLGLLMNADFQELMQNVEVLTENLLQKLGIPADKAEELMNQLQQEMPADLEETVQTVQKEQTVESTEQSITAVQTEENETADVPKIEVVQKDVESTDSVEEEMAVPKEEVQKEIQSGQNQSSDDLSEEADNQTADEQDSIFRQNSGVKEERGTFEDGMVQTVQTAKVADVTVSNVAGSVQNTTVNVTDIIQQVSEFTKIMYQENVTSMEMQLNPENLGKIYVQVSSKEGVITAQLAAQNEAVKEVLESQVAVLKENMNQQGLKVEAVEVTIASHEFERNLEENQQNQGQEEQKEQASKNHRRGISLNQLDEMSGLMSEEEALVAKIMRENGNSVDFTA